MSKFQEKRDEKQANQAIQALQEAGKIAGVGTNRNYLAVLQVISKTIKGDLKNLTRDQAIGYLTDRSSELGQKSLDMSRQAMQHLINEKLPVIKTEKTEFLKSKSYTPGQIQEIAKHQNQRNALATKIVHSSGLRAHELFTLRPVSEQKADVRPSNEFKFSGREPGQIYTVVGKGGLTREISIPDNLAKELEQNRLDGQISVTDRGVHYEQHYNISAGVNFSRSFSRVSNTVLGHSHGAHGLRHSYVQERMKEVTASTYKEALIIVSQEIGHFSTKNTETYLR